MMSTKPALVFSSCASASTALPRFAASPPPLSCAACQRPRAQRSRGAWARNYAQHASSHGEEPDLSWPDPIHPHKTPTPYQILALRQGEAYSKHRFYSLVKLYHPDSCHPTSPVSHLPHTVRLERYRLLVAAHSILSDDAKRKAYDLWGHGWHRSHRTPTAHGHTHMHFKHDPMRNATWEDWEQWYRREYDRPHTEEPTTIMSNLAFWSLIFALVSLGGVVQGTRATALSTSVMEQRDRVHNEASMGLAGSRRATMLAAGDRDERIQTFLRRRDAMHTEETYQQILPPSETPPLDTVRKQ
ncbi:hypothetical protein BCR34DRAFT_589097 [Clohesyomyces aquaticus]|uniref:J domain-containing protein n=1 Tax=Clohesyomyces aquaticus TaxID=1231657 RepID=A0A1Y1ZIV6_9PLEO|nr:hypothetical protein BCR34DRAFT_589097 [Clohesyomyces aquaticus]